MFKNRKRFLFRFFGFVLVLSILVLIVLIIFSPYGFDKQVGYKRISESIRINASPEEVFSYLGNSDHARDWSVFVDHIITLNGENVPDGHVGSKRRCFCQADSKGTRWDEKITLVEKNRRRQLVIFNLVNFKMEANGLASEQIYEQSENGCKLTFTLFFKNKNPGFLDELKTYLAAYKAQDIFKRNLANIKRLVEKEKAERLHHNISITPAAP